MERWQAEREWREIRKQLDMLYQKQDKLLAEEEATSGEIRFCLMKKLCLSALYPGISQDENPKMNIAIGCSDSTK